MERFPNSLDLFYISIWEFGEVMPFSVVSRDMHLGVHKLLLKPVGSDKLTVASCFRSSSFVVYKGSLLHLILTQPVSGTLNDATCFEACWKSL